MKNRLKTWKNIQEKCTKRRLFVKAKNVHRLKMHKKCRMKMAGRERELKMPIVNPNNFNDIMMGMISRIRKPTKTVTRGE